MATNVGDKSCEGDRNVDNYANNGGNENFHCKHDNIEQIEAI